MKRILAAFAVIAAGLVAFACIIIQFLSFPPAAAIAREAALKDYLPTQMYGWVGEDAALAGTEAVAEEVEKILQFDEYVYRQYKKQGREFSVYICYWRPGKMPSREIAFHIPDKCWPTTGWKRVSAVHDYRPGISHCHLGPGQLRSFAQSGVLQHVLYWHIFSGQILVYNRDGSPGDFTLFTDLLRLGLLLKGEQYFIRVSSPEPLENLYADEGFIQIMELLGPLGPGLSHDLVEFEG